MATAIKERPIIFSGGMVRAILDGRKTMTRRVIKSRHGFEIDDPGDGSGRRWAYYPAYVVDSPDPVEIPCPYGQPGERLWVKETFCCVNGDPAHDGTPHETDVVHYRADDGAFNELADAYRLWRPSIFMPRCYSRLMLEVTDVRVERVQEITEEDAIAEGFNTASYRDGRGEESARFGCRELWEKLNGPRGYGWGSNPPVWVVSFKMLGD